MSEWQPVKKAPTDGAWFLLRGRTPADRPMVPVVVSYRLGEGIDSSQAFRDSGSLRDCTFLLHGNADWMPLPTWQNDTEKSKAIL